MSDKKFDAYKRIEELLKQGLPVPLEIIGEILPEPGPYCPPSSAFYHALNGDYEQVLLKKHMEDCAICREEYERMERLLNSTAEEDQWFKKTVRRATAIPPLPPEPMDDPDET